MNSAWDLFKRAQNRPDFGAWARGLVWLPQLSSAEMVLTLAAEDAVALALLEMKTALGNGSAGIENGSRLQDILLQLSDISESRGESRPGLRQFIKRQYDYFDHHVRLATGHGLSCITRLQVDPPGLPAAMEQCRACLGELLQEVWVRLFESGAIPFLDPARATTLTQEAMTLAATAPQAAEVKRIAEALERRGFFENVTAIRAAVAAVAPAAAWEIGDIGPRSHSVEQLDMLAQEAKLSTTGSPTARLKVLGKAGRMQDAKALALRHWDEVSTNAVRLTGALALPWGSIEREQISPRLRALLEAPATPAAIANVAALMLFAWNRESDAVAAYIAAGRLSEAGIGAAAQLIPKLPPPLPGGELAPDSSGLPLTQHIEPGAKHAMIVMPWGGDRFIFGMPPDLVHRMLRQFSCHILYLHDQSRHFYLRGIPGIGSTYEDTIAAIKDVCARMGASHIHMLGFSGHAFSAINYAIDLGAHSVLAYSPRTSARGDVLEQDRAARRAGTEMRPFIPEQRQDIRARLLSLPAYPPMTIRYGSDCDVDAMHARRLDGIEGVELRPHDGWTGHDSLIASIMRDEFDSDIRQMLAANGVRRS